MINYPVLVYPGRGGAVRIVIPDFKFTVEGESMLDAMSMSVEAVTAIYHRRRNRGDPIPEPSRLSDIRLLKKTKDGFKTLVYVEEEENDESNKISCE